MNDLPPKQLQAIFLIVEGKTQREAADILEVTPQTISEWKKLTGFEICLNNTKLELITSGREAIRTSVGSAVNCLKDLANNAESEETRRKAANDILTMAGVADPRDERFTWGIGPLSESELSYKATFTNILDGQSKDKFS